MGSRSGEEERAVLPGRERGEQKGPSHLVCPLGTFDSEQQKPALSSLETEIREGEKPGGCDTQQKKFKDVSGMPVTL